MQRTDKTLVVLGTGGTIAGTAASAGDNIGYTAAQLGVATLVKAVPALAGVPLETEQVAQVDSKDMGDAVWRALVARVAHHLARPEVAGLVVTHGTDTLEETAWLLQRVLAPAKPVVLTAAMRPATSLQPDGPQNLLDAVTVARHPGAQGVVAVLGGVVHGAADVAKVHTYRIDAFDSGDAGPVARIEEGRVRVFRPWPAGQALGAGVVAPEAWPRVGIVLSHAGVDGLLVDALVQQGARGIVAEREYTAEEWPEASPEQRRGMTHLRHAFWSRPHFVAYWVDELPAVAPWIAHNIFGLPLLTWTVRTPEQRARAARHADQMIFEGFLPGT